MGAHGSAYICLALVMFVARGLDAAGVALACRAPICAAQAKGTHSVPPCGTCAM